MTEEELENVAISYFTEVGYTHVFGPYISPDGYRPEREYDEVVLRQRLKKAIQKLNPYIPSEAHDEAIRKVLRIAEPDLLQANKAFHQFLTDGVPVTFRKATGETKSDLIRLVDFQHMENNEFLVINQYTIVENQNKRPDVLLFVNGLPLVIIELKNATKEDTDIHMAFKQLKTYQQAIPSLFVYNALQIISDGFESRTGTLTSDFSRFMQWKSIDGQIEAARNIAEMEVMIRGMLAPARLLDIVRHFVVFEEGRQQTFKKVGAYHQYFAVNKAVESTKTAAQAGGNGKAGVVWHTQGSGKSLSMVFYTGKLVLKLNNPTIVIVTDRNDLDDQLFDTFAACSQLLRQKPVQVERREDLQKYLQVASGGIVFTTIQKFLPENRGEEFPVLSTRRNIVVIADEAHRTQYGFDAKVVTDPKDAKTYITYGFAKYLRDALPQASFIGFTGTPVELTDRETKQVFGEYIDIYDIKQAVDDGATVPIFYESRLAKIDMKEESMYSLDDSLDAVAEESEVYKGNADQLKSKWARVEEIVGEPKRLQKVAQDIVTHYEKRQQAMDGKAMVVCMSRRICVELYNAIIALRPDWHHPDDTKGAIKIVMTGTSSDPVSYQPHIRSKEKRKAIGDRLRDPFDPLKIIIVRDMFLTGFDAPCLHTLYIDKPMQGHNLMQAIARVNRVFGDKPGGLIVDYLGIAMDLKKALATYTQSGGRGKPTFDQAEAVALMQEKHEILAHDIFNGFDYKPFFALPAIRKLGFILDATDHILAEEERKTRFIQRVTELSKAFALCNTTTEAAAIRDDLGFFQAVKARIVKMAETTKIIADEKVEVAVRQIISDALIPGEVIDIFDAAGLQKPDVTILSEGFLAEVKDMPQRNVAFEVLKKLLNDEIKAKGRRNILQGKIFSEMLENAVRKYQNKVINASQVIEELIEVAREIRQAKEKGQALGLTEDEEAFYDALETNDSAVKVLGDDKLRFIARELVESLRQNVGIDWDKKEAVRAKLRVLVKRILRHYGYPPDKHLEAVERIIKQTEHLAKEWI